MSLVEFPYVPPPKKSGRCYWCLQDVRRVALERGVWGEIVRTRRDLEREGYSYDLSWWLAALDLREKLGIPEGAVGVARDGKVMDIERERMTPIRAAQALLRIPVENMVRDVKQNTVPEVEWPPTHEDLTEWFANRKAGSRAQALEWVAGNLNFDGVPVNWQTAPSAAAVNLLRWAQSHEDNTRSFWRDMYGKGGKDAEQVKSQKDAAEEDRVKQLEQIEATKRAIEEMQKQ